MYIETVLAKGIKGGFRLGTVHGLGGDDLILVAVSGFRRINAFEEGKLISYHCYNIAKQTRL